MPRHVERDFLALAISQNRRAWSIETDVPQSAFERAADRTQAMWLKQRRARLVSRIDDAINLPAGFCRSTYFGVLSGGLALSAEEAVDELRRLIRQEIERCRRRHWSAAPQRIPALQEALIFARYFRRFGARVWMRQAA
jgi:hypothetical protein